MLRGPSRVSLLFFGPVYSRARFYYRDVRLSRSYIRILDSSFDGGAEIHTKWRWNLFPGLILGAFCTSFEPDPSGGVLGPSFGRKTTEKSTKTKIYLVSYHDRY